MMILNLIKMINPKIWLYVFGAIVILLFGYYSYFLREKLTKTQNEYLLLADDYKRTIENYEHTIELINKKMEFSNKQKEDKKEVEVVIKEVIREVEKRGKIDENDVNDNYFIVSF